MSNVLDYLRWRGDVPICSPVPLCPVDYLILTIYVYCPLEQLNTFPTTISEACPLLYSNGAPKEAGTLVYQRYEICQMLKDSNRFGSIKILDFRADFDAQREIQFAAALFQVGSMRIIAYRGTDASIVGWKEDFNMSLETPVPSQLSAVEFLGNSAQMNKFDGAAELSICGHSKGGNLALYAAAMTERSVQDRIRTIYNFDGPGMSDQVLQSAGWARIQNKVQTFIPESSIIGLLLGHQGEKHIIESSGVSIWQHNVFNWHILGPTFIAAEQTTFSSRFIDGTLDDFLDGCDDSQRQVLIETLFNLINAIGATRFNEIPKCAALHINDIRTYIRQMPESDQQIMKQVLRTLLESGGENARSIMDLFRNSEEQSVRNAVDNLKYSMEGIYNKTDWHAFLDRLQKKNT